MLVPGTGAALVGVDDGPERHHHPDPLGGVLRTIRAPAAPTSRTRATWESRSGCTLSDAKALWPETGGRHRGCGERPRASGLPRRRELSRTGRSLGRARRRLGRRQGAPPDGGRTLPPVTAVWRRAVFTGSGSARRRAQPLPRPQRSAGLPDRGAEPLCTPRQRPLRRGVGHDRSSGRDQQAPLQGACICSSSPRIEVRDPQAIDVDAEVARREAARPDGVIPYGWGHERPTRSSSSGNLEMLQEAKAEIERMAPNPAILGRDTSDCQWHARCWPASRAASPSWPSIYGALEDFELAIYRQCWARAKQYWTAPQCIRVTRRRGRPALCRAEPAGDAPRDRRGAGLREPRRRDGRRHRGRHPARGRDRSAGGVPAS